MLIKKPKHTDESKQIIKERAPLFQMYGNRKNSTAAKKNPNRVVGGIRGSGNDFISVIDGDGKEYHVPTERYTNALIEQLKNQITISRNLDKKLTSLSRDFENIKGIIRLNSQG